MAFDAFLKLDGVEGESKDEKHKDEIEILSFSFGVANLTNAGGGGGGAGKATFQDFHFVARTQSSSPVLFQSCATGKHIKEGILTARKAGGDQQEYLKIRFTDVLITQFKQAGDASSGEGVPLEEVSLNFSKIEVQYTPGSSKGTVE